MPSQVGKYLAMSYLSDNAAYWSLGVYDAPNPESCVFRTYGRILKHDFGLSGSGGERLLDFGCGPGGNTRFYAERGFDVYGVDLSEVDIHRCKDRMREIGDHFKVIDPKPRRSDRFFGDVTFKIVTAIQSLYYYSDSDLEERMISLFDQMDTGAVFMATMMGTKCWYYDMSEETEDGLRLVKLHRTTDKHREGLVSSNHYINFTGSKEQLERKFCMFKRCHVGFYDYCYRDDEGPEFHWVFFGQKM